MLDPETVQSLEEEIAQEGADTSSDEESQLDRLLNSANLTERYTEQELKTMGHQLIEYIEADDDSRQEWKDKVNDYLKLAVQVKEDKSFPWPDASNVKYPLLTTAAMQFQSRCYKALVGSARPVKARVIGNDKLGLKKARANRISEHMSYQLLEELPDWEEHMDTLCMVVPICGNAFKKTFFDGSEIKSELVLPQDLIVNFYSTSLEQAPRKTHRMYLSMNELVTNVRSGYYDRINFDSLHREDSDQFEDEEALLEGQGLTRPQDTSDPSVPFKVYECHCWWDLDEDGYEEPYIVTILDVNKQVVRITPRFAAKDVEVNEQDEIVRIKPSELFTNYRFLPDPRSGIYGIGFGHILGPINEAVDTLINQLVDSGTMSNMPSGWLARGARMQGGIQAFKPGEWRITNTMADDLRKAIFPLPIKEPSVVLFNLLGLFIEAGKNLASVTDIMQGKSPGQNQPFSTTSAIMEQGMAVYSTIFKRMHRAFKKELAKIYRLNSLYLPPEVYFNVVDPETGEGASAQIAKADYEKNSADVVPNTDPEQVSNFQKLADAELLYGLLQTKLVNPHETIKRILEARNIENIGPILELPPPQPTAEHELKSRELDIKEATQQAENEINMYKAQYQAARDQASSIAKLAEAQMMNANQQLDIMKEKFHQMLETAKITLEETRLALEKEKVESEKLKKEKEEREKKTIKVSDLK